MRPKFKQFLEGALGSKDISEINPKITDKPIEVDENNWKQYFATLFDGCEIYFVDGEYVRKTFLVDFTMGGHHWVYPKFIPRDQIWIEKMLYSEDSKEDLLHEIIERTFMRFGDVYETAHEKATNVEEIMRKFDSHVKNNINTH